MAKSIYDGRALHAAIKDFSQPLRVYETVIPDEWIDFNGHLTEARYLECFSYSSDSLMLMFGCDDDYVKAGNSFFTAETHIRHLDEAGLGAKVYVTSQLLQAEGKKLHVYHRLYHERPGEEDNLLATGEQLLLHVNLETRRTSIPEAGMLEKMEYYGGQHKSLPVPEDVGRGIGQRR